MNILFVGNVIPEDLFYQLSNVSPSTNNVQLRYVRILKESLGNKIYIVSITRLTSKLDSSKIVPEYTFSIYDNLTIRTPSFFNNRVLLNGSLLFNAIKLIRKIRKKLLSGDERVLFVINNHFYLYSLPVLFSKRKDDLMITILNEGFDVRFLNTKKKFFRNTINNIIHKFAIKKNNGLITFNKNTVLDYAPNIPFISLIYPCEFIPELYTNYRLKTNNRFVLYAGLIDDCYGIREILNAFSKLPENYYLIICGGGSKELIDLIKYNASISNRIIFKGMIKRTGVIRLEHLVDLLLLIRKQSNPHEEYIAKYCQPSKISEYLLSKTPILATNIDSIPLELKAFMFFCEPTPDSIANGILEVFRKTDEIEAKTTNGFEYVRKNCNYLKLKEDISLFVKKIIREDNF